jgi:hypothetical protein
MVTFQFYLQLVEPEKLWGAGVQLRQVGWMGDDSHVVFGQEFPDENGNMRWCVVMQHSVFLLAKPLHIFIFMP